MSNKVTEAQKAERLEFRPDADGEFDELVARFADGGVFVETMSDQGVYIDFTWDDGLHCGLWITCGGRAKLHYSHEQTHDRPPALNAWGKANLAMKALEQTIEGGLRDAYLEGWRTGLARAQGQGPSNTPMHDWVDSMAKVRTAALATKDTPND